MAQILSGNIRGLQNLIERAVILCHGRFSSCQLSSDRFLSHRPVLSHMDAHQPASSDRATIAPSYGAWWKGSQMVRVSVVRSSSQAVTLQIEGSVKGRCVKEIRRSFEGAFSLRTQEILALGGVSFT